MPLTPETRDALTAGISQLVRAGRHLVSRSAAQLYGELPSFGWALLMPLEHDGEQRCTALAARAGVDASVASRQIATLERSGHVERRPDPADGRASLFRLTPQGSAALAAARALRSDWALGALAGWDEADGRLLTRLLENLIADLEAAQLPGSAPPRPRDPIDAAPATRHFPAPTTGEQP
jgi:DNA-binding MarR family transcriptional regulator